LLQPLARKWLTCWCSLSPHYANLSLAKLLALYRPRRREVGLMSGHGKFGLGDMTQHPNKKIEVLCPCCGARLSIDTVLGKVIYHAPPPKHAKAPDIDHAAQLLEKEKARREALFKQSTEEEKIKSQLLERKFAEALKQRKDEPAGPPLKDIDLD
jgi:predicted amidophosphoribosyltransferase